MDEKVITNQEGSNRYVVTVGYTEIDYSKNRLVQRRKKEAPIEFIVEDKQNTIRIRFADLRAGEELHVFRILKTSK